MPFGSNERPVRRALMASVLTGLCGQAALIISGVIVARMLGVENRGNLALLTVLPLLIAQFGGLGLPVATTFEIAREPSIARPLLRSLRRFIGLQTIALMLLHATILVALVGDRRREVQLAALYTMVAVPAFVALQHGLAVMQGQQRYREFNLLRLAPALLYAALAVAVFVVDQGTLPVLAACFGACWFITGVTTLVLAILGSGPQTSEASPPRAAKLVKFGTRSVLGSSSPSDGAGIDQAAVGLFLSTRALGLYVVASAFMSLSRLVTQSIGLVAYPNVAARRDSGDAERAMWRFAALGVAAALAIIIALELSVGRLIVLFFGKSFAPAEGVARLLLIAALFAGARRVLSDAARGANRPLVGTLAEITSWAVLLPGMIVLTPLLELTGVAIALVVASMASLLIIVRGVRRSPRNGLPDALRMATAVPEVAIKSRDVG